MSATTAEQGKPEHVLDDRASTEAVRPRYAATTTTTTTTTADHPGNAEIIGRVSLLSAQTAVNNN